MKKIGILTYFWADNPGTFLQAFSTYKALESILPNAKVEIVDYKHRHVFYKPSLNHILKNRLIDGFKRHITFQKLIKEELPLTHDQILSRERKTAADFIKRQNYDMIVVGSDTVLNFLPFHYKRNEIPIYWLPKDITCKKIAAASSSGALSLKELSEAQVSECRVSMEDFDLIGVRDGATYNLISSLNIRNKSSLEIIPDPTFTFDIDCSVTEKYFSKTGFDPTHKFVIIDLPRRFAPANQIAHHFRDKGYRIVSLVPVDYADYCFINISPFEWAGIYRYCQFVITQRFHGTIFSLKNLVPVISIVWTNQLKTHEGLSKYLSLLKSFDLHEVSYIDCTSSNYMNKIYRNAERVMAEFDKRSIQEKLAQFRNDYMKFIGKAFL